MRLLTTIKPFFATMCFSADQDLRLYYDDKLHNSLTLLELSRFTT